MSATGNGRVVPGQQRSFGVPPFDGYPYLATRIGHSPLRHVLLLPADWPRDRFEALARRQRDANRLDTCLAVGPRDGLYLAADDCEWPSDHMPYGIPVTDRLLSAESVPDTAELADRRTRLAAFVDANSGTGYLVGDGLEDGRQADQHDMARLLRRNIYGLPAGHRGPLSVREREPLRPVRWGIGRVSPECLLVGRRRLSRLLPRRLRRARPPLPGRAHHGAMMVI